jgi:hypothetical protein
MPVHVDGLHGKHFILKILTLNHHYNLMIDAGADPEEVVSYLISCDFFFIKIMGKSAKL